MEKSISLEKLVCDVFGGFLNLVRICVCDWFVGSCGVGEKMVVYSLFLNLRLAEIKLIKAELRST